jgi:hypothetical protein
VGIRETLNQNPGITTGVTAGLIVVALGLIIWQSTGGGSGPSFNNKQFFSNDEGATTFVDDAAKIPPFDKDGKPAVRAYVYTCDGGKTKFTAYLERYTDAAKKKLEASKNNPTDIGMMEEISMTGIEVKKPGAAEKWVRQSTPQGSKVMDFACKDGTKNSLELALP